MKKIKSLLMITLIIFTGCKKESKNIYSFNEQPYENITINNPIKIELDQLKDNFYNELIKVTESYTYVSDNSITFEKDLECISNQEKIDVNIVTDIGGYGFELSTHGKVNKQDAINYQYNRNSSYEFLQDLSYELDNEDRTYTKEYSKKRNRLKEENDAIKGNFYENINKYNSMHESLLRSVYDGEFSNYCKMISSASFHHSEDYSSYYCGRYSNIEVISKTKIDDITIKHRKETVITYTIRNDHLTNITYSYTYYTNGRDDGELYKKESKIYAQLIGEISFDYGDRNRVIGHNYYGG